MISTNVSKLRSALAGKDVKIVAVTKNADIPQIKIAKEVGITAFGENKVQEALPKIAALKSAEWHFIGHLQSNKVKKAVENFQVIQSVDSVELAKRIDKEASNLGKRMTIFLQINFSKDGRQGFSVQKFGSAYKEILNMKNLDAQGIMMIAPICKNPEKYFKKAKELHNRYKLKHLSMGMSDDWEKAVECGSTMIRIGRGIFGKV
jgi:PLP dependent protein